MGDDLKRHAAQPSFATVSELYAQLHTLTNELCDLLVKGCDAQVQARLGELHDLQEAMLERLQALV